MIYTTSLQHSSATCAAAGMIRLLLSSSPPLPLGAAEASKQVEHKWHSMCTSESWRTLVFLKAVIHFVGNDDDGGKRGVGVGSVGWKGHQVVGNWTAPQTALLKWSEKKHYFPLEPKSSCLSRSFEATQRWYCGSLWQASLECRKDMTWRGNIFLTWVKIRAKGTIPPKKDIMVLLFHLEILAGSTVALLSHLMHCHFLIVRKYSTSVVQQVPVDRDCVMTVKLFWITILCFLVQFVTAGHLTKYEI